MRIFFEAWQSFRMWMHLNHIIDQYRKAGSTQPEYDAMQEVDLRALLEDLRDFVSAHWMEHDTLDDAAQAWRELELQPRMRLMDFKVAKMISKVVRDMKPSELLHPSEYEKWLNRREQPSHIKWNDLQARVLLTGR